MDLIQMTVCYPGAGSVAAFLLGVSGNGIRLAMNGWQDAAEFRLVNGQWLSEDNEPVEIESKPQPSWALDPAASAGLVRYAPPVPSRVVWVN
jgi:hypothetical protein